MRWIKTLLIRFKIYGIFLNLINKKILYININNIEDFLMNNNSLSHS